MGTTLDSPLHYVNSTRILARMGPTFLPTFIRSLRACQVFGTITGEKFSVNIDNRAIDCTLDQLYFILFIYLFLLFLFVFLGIVPYFIYAVTWSRLHTSDFRKAFSVHAKTRS